MSNIYVAGKNLARARSVMDNLIANGHVITFDWITGIENETEADFPSRAKIERLAVQQSELLVYLWESDQESARYEAGMAMGLNKPIIVSGFKKKRFFLSLPEVICVEEDNQILEAVNDISISSKEN